MSARFAGSSLLGVGAAALALLLGGRYALSEDQQEPMSRETIELSETSRLIQAELPLWQIAVGADEAALKLEPNPILRWTNPATGRIYGEIYVWTAGGRPETVMSLYKAWQPAWGFAGEFHSLSQTNLIARRDQKVAWKYDRPGFELQEMSDTPAPAENAQRRLRQMRAMAADFSAVLFDRRRNPDGERQALRLLINPAYRYAAPDGEAIDGAIFAFVVGTDPEALLLIEARGKSNEARWNYAFARLNCDELAAYYKEREVWRVARSVYERRDQPYCVMSLPDSTPRE